MKEAFDKRVDEVKATLRTLRVTGRTFHAIVSETILLLLRNGPMTPSEIHNEVQRLHSDLCDNTIKRVIHGESYGKKWKHTVRQARDHLKNKGFDRSTSEEVVVGALSKRSPTPRRQHVTLAADPGISFSDTPRRGSGHFTTSRARRPSDTMHHTHLDRRRRAGRATEPRPATEPVPTRREPPMPSPFPGMDPYLENAKLWPAFQHQLLACLYQILLPGLVDRYRARVGTRTYVSETPLFTSIIREQFAHPRHGQQKNQHLVTQHLRTEHRTRRGRGRCPGR